MKRFIETTGIAIMLHSLAFGSLAHASTTPKLVTPGLTTPAISSVNTSMARPSITNTATPAITSVTTSMAKSSITSTVMPAIISVATSAPKPAITTTQTIDYLTPQQLSDPNYIAPGYKLESGISPSDNKPYKVVVCVVSPCPIIKLGPAPSTTTPTTTTQPTTTVPTVTASSSTMGPNETALKQSHSAAYNYVTENVGGAGAKYFAPVVAGVGTAFGLNKLLTVNNIENPSGSSFNQNPRGGQNGGQNWGGRGGNSAQDAIAGDGEAGGQLGVGPTASETTQISNAARTEAYGENLMNQADALNAAYKEILGEVQTVGKVDGAADEVP